MTGPIDNGQGADNTGAGQGTDTGVNPAWNEYLTDVPQEFHEKVIPAFKAWDSGVDTMVKKVHSEYEPWKSVMSQTTPETASWAVSVANALNTDPQMVYEALGEWLQTSQNNNNGQQNQQGGSNTGQGQQQNNNNQDTEPWRSEVANLQNQQKLMVDFFQQQRLEQQNAALDNQLENELAAAKKTYGLQDKDLPFVLGLMANNDLATDAAAKAVAEYSGSFRPKPLIMGSGGGVPGAGINPAKLDDKGTKDLVVQMLMANKQAQD